MTSIANIDGPRLLAAPRPPADPETLALLRYMCEWLPSARTEIWRRAVDEKRTEGELRFALPGEDPPERQRLALGLLKRVFSTPGPVSVPGVEGGWEGLGLANARVTLKGSGAERELVLRAEWALSPRKESIPALVERAGGDRRAMDVFSRIADEKLDGLNALASLLASPDRTLLGARIDRWYGQAKADPSATPAEHLDDYLRAQGGLESPAEVALRDGEARRVVSEALSALAQTAPGFNEEINRAASEGMEEFPVLIALPWPGPLVAEDLMAVTRLFCSILQGHNILHIPQTGDRYRGAGLDNARMELVQGGQLRDISADMDLSRGVDPQAVLLRLTLSIADPKLEPANHLVIQALARRYPDVALLLGDVRSSDRGYRLTRWLAAAGVDQAYQCLRVARLSLGAHGNRQLFANFVEAALVRAAVPEPPLAVPALNIPELLI